MPWEKNMRARKCRDLGECRKGCSRKVDNETQKILFQDYWSLGSYNKRVAYSASLITIEDKKTEKKNQTGIVRKKREFSCKYHFKINGKLLEVCKGCFQKTFDVSNKFISSV